MAGSEGHSPEAQAELAKQAQPVYAEFISIISTLSGFNTAIANKGKTSTYNSSAIVKFVSYFLESEDSVKMVLYLSPYNKFSVLMTVLKTAESTKKVRVRKQQTPVTNAKASKDLNVCIIL